MKTIPAQIVKATDLEARRKSAAENVQRQDLSAIEKIEGIVELVDAELIKDIEYQRAEIRRQRSESGDQSAEGGGRRPEVVRRRWEKTGRSGENLAWKT